MKKPVVLFVTIIIILVYPLNAGAMSFMPDIPGAGEIDGGDGQYLKYRDNYALDIKKPGLTEQINGLVNSIANAIFSFAAGLAYITIYLFYLGLSLNIADLLGGILNDVNEALRNMFFGSAIFIIVFATSAWFIIKQFLQGNVQNVLAEIGKVVVIVVISFAVVNESSSFLSFVNTTAKQISVDALGSFSGQTVSVGNSLNQYAANAAGVLWGSLVHNPWEALEFIGNESHAGNHAENILRLPFPSQEREDLIKGLYDSDGLFDPAIASKRLGTSIVLVLVTSIKCLFYLIIAGLLLGFQVLTLFYVILCPLILILAVSPQFGGIDLIWNWLKKVVETQMSIFILTLVIGIIIMTDNFLTGLGGWFVIQCVQVVIMVVLVVFWKKVLAVVSKTAVSIKNPTFASNMRDMQQKGNLYDDESGGVMARIRARKQERAAAADGRAGNNAAINTNYNNTPQYHPKQEALGEELTVAPVNTANIQAVRANPELELQKAQQKAQEKIQSGKADDKLEKKDNVIDYSKIKKYQKSRGGHEQEQNPISYQKISSNHMPEQRPASNPESYQQSTGKNSAARAPISVTGAANYNKRGEVSSEAPPRAYTPSYESQASRYTPGAKTAIQAAPEPRAVNYNNAAADIPNYKSKPVTDKFEFDSKRVTTDHDKKAAGVEPAPVKRVTTAEQQANKPAGRPASISSDVRSYKPKPVTDKFEFDSKRVESSQNRRKAVGSDVQPYRPTNTGKDKK
ncbi:MAG: hypothetical protein FWG94_08055 [Oscillospiraceae bacterium]|nr:hypothetical protein [Oscillospiraceae bacterium]